MDRQVQKAGKRMKAKIIITLIFAILYPVVMLVIFPIGLVGAIVDFILSFLDKLFFEMRVNYISNIKYLIEKLKNF